MNIYCLILFYNNPYVHIINTSTHLITAYFLKNYVTNKKNSYELTINNRYEYYNDIVIPIHENVTILFQTYNLTKFKMFVESYNTIHTL